MASIKAGLLAGVASSMRDRPDVSPGGAPGVSPGSAPLSPGGPAGVSPGSAQAKAEGRRRLESAAAIRLDRIDADPNQPRTEFESEALARLADSLRERGQLQPIRVRWDAASSRYVVVVGERRWRAARLAGLESLACVVVDGEPSPEDLLEDQLIENALREDLKPVEQARAYRSLMQARGLSTRQLADRLRVAPGSITKALALLDLPGDVRDAVEAGRIAATTAYELSRIEDPAEQAELAREAAAGRLKRDEIQVRARTPRTGAGKGKGGAAASKRPPKGRIFRSPAGRVTVELKRAGGPEAMLDLLRESIRVLEAEVSSIVGPGTGEGRGPGGVSGETPATAA